MANYNYTIKNSYSPFSMQEMLAPLTLYKEAFEKDEEQYINLRKEADKFKYLSAELPEGSKARAIYESYANDLNEQAMDFATNGLTMNNRRALTDLRARYQGEIGLLDSADKALKEEMALRRELSAKDPTMLYATNTNDLSIDNFLNEKRPNLYNISGTDLYNRAAVASQAASKRQFSVNGDSKTLGGYYRDFVEKMGYTPEQVSRFGEQISADFANWAASSIPELGLAANQIMESTGANANLSGNDKLRAQQQVIRGLVDGAVYNEKHNPQRDLGVETPHEELARTKARIELEENGYKYDEKTKSWIFDAQQLKDRIKARLEAYGEKGIPAYDPDNYIIGPDGKPHPKPGAGKDSKDGKDKTETKTLASKEKALKDLDRTTLASNQGFDVSFGGENGVSPDRHHYDYIGAISNHNNKWYSGKLHEDNPGHNGLAGWGWASTSNVENGWGNFSLGDTDNAEMRVLLPSEIASLENDENLGEKIKDVLYAARYYNKSILEDLKNQYDYKTLDEAAAVLEKNGYKPITDYQIIGVKNEWPHSDRENYAIAVRTK